MHATTFQNLTFKWKQKIKLRTKGIKYNNEKETVSSTAFSFAFKSLLLNPAIELCFPSKSAIYYCLVYLKVLFSFKPSQKALAYVLTVKHSRF